MKQLFSITSESRSSIRHESVSLRNSNLLTQISFRVLAILALFALWDIKRNDVISDGESGDAFSDAFNNSGAFVSEDDWEESFWIVSVKSVGVSVANGGEEDFDANFVGFWWCHLDGFDGKGRLGTPGDSSFAIDNLSNS